MTIAYPRFTTTKTFYGREALTGEENLDEYFHNMYLDYVNTQSERKSVNIDFSNKCLLQCPRCMRQLPEGKKKVKLSHDMSFGDFKKVVQSFKYFHMCGQISDPIYHPHLIKFLRHASDNDVHIQVHTNGSSKKRDFWEQAFSIKYPIRWLFGIDGLDQETVNLHRIGQNFKSAFKAMLLGSRSHHKIVWQFIPFKHNQHQIDRAVQIARKYNIEFMLLKSNRWDRIKIIVNNKFVIPDWLQPPDDPNLFVEQRHALIKKEVRV